MRTIVDKAFSGNIGRMVDFTVGDVVVGYDAPFTGDAAEYTIMVIVGLAVGKNISLNNEKRYRRHRWDQHR